MFPLLQRNSPHRRAHAKFYAGRRRYRNTLVQFEMLVPPKVKVPAAHFHVEVDETLYIMKGTITQLVGAETRELNAGEVCCIKRGVMHGFSNLHETTARVLCTLSLASIGPAYFREIADVIRVGGPPDVPAILVIMKRHGPEVLRPA